jgi:FkbM family methyltransferase
LGRLPPGVRLPVERFYDYYLCGHYVCDEVRLIRRLCNRDRLALDVGANRGQLTPFLLRYSSAVHCFEPIPALCDHLRYRFRGCRVSVENCALGNVTGTLPLHIPILKGLRIDTRSSLVKTFSDDVVRGERIESVERVLVPVRRLDDLRLRNVGFIKIDVEGYESEVLEGARETIDACHPNFLVEIEQRHRRAGDMRDLFADFERRGYCGYFVYENEILPIGKFDFHEMQNPARERSHHYVSNFGFSRSRLA